MKTKYHALFGALALAFAAHASAEITFYEHEGFQGRSFSTQDRLGNLDRANFNDRASSVIVNGSRWEACEDVRFSGRCVVLRPGQYPSLRDIGLNDRVSSVRPVPANARVSDADYAPMPPVAQDFRRRRDERLFEAQVTQVREVVGNPGQRCWIERQQVSQAPQVQGQPNVAGAVVGAALGGILGHQVGGGSGKDLATIGGVVGGAALGAQVGRNQQQPAAVAQDVRRCDNNPAQATPGYFDVTYEFNGQQHHVQMATPPGRTIIVNRAGEPRV